MRDDDGIEIIRIPEAGIEIIRIPKGAEYCALPLLEYKPNAKAPSSSRAGALIWVGLFALAGVLAVGAWLVWG